MNYRNNSNGLELDQSSDSNLKFILLPLAKRNYYNSDLNAVRVQDEENQFDISLGAVPFEVPHPSRHVVLIVSESSFSSGESLSEDRLDLPPGMESETNISDRRMDIGFIISRNQRISNTYPSNASSTQSIKNVNFSDNENSRIAITPTIDRPYTNTEEMAGDKRNSSIGLFINDSVVMIKSHGGQITLGDEGIHLGGNIHWSSSKHGKEIMADNMFHGWVPQTTPTAGLSIPYIINITKFVNIGKAGQKFVSIGQKFSKIPSIIG